MYVTMHAMTKSYDIAVFAPSDGLTPLQTKKLNQNFQRLLDLVSGRDENTETVVKTAAVVQEYVIPVVMDIAYPIGSLILAKDATSLPAWGEWQEVTQYNNRFIRLGSFGNTGGSATQTIECTMPSHTHTYYKQVAGNTIKVEESSASGAKNVLTSIKDASATTNTSSAGNGSDQVISTIPPYVTMKLFERVA